MVKDKGLVRIQFRRSISQWTTFWILNYRDAKTRNSHTFNFFIVDPWNSLPEQLWQLDISFGQFK